MYYFGEDIYFQAFSAMTLDGDLQLITTFKQYLPTKNHRYALNTTHDQRAKIKALDKRNVR